MSSTYEKQDEITIDIELDVYDLLSKMAEADRRTRKQEANFIIAEEARRRGLSISSKVLKKAEVRSRG